MLKSLYCKIHIKLQPFKVQNLISRDHTTRGHVQWHSTPTNQHHEVHLRVTYRHEIGDKIRCTHRQEDQ